MIFIHSKTSTTPQNSFYIFLYILTLIPTIIEKFSAESADPSGLKKRCIVRRDNDFYNVVHSGLLRKKFNGGTPLNGTLIWINQKYCILSILVVKKIILVQS